MMCRRPRIFPMPTNDQMPLPAMHADAGSDLHASVASGVRGEVCREPSLRRNAKPLPSTRRKRKKFGPGYGFKEVGVDAFEAPAFSDGYQSHRNLVAAVLGEAIFEFRDRQVRARYDIKRRNGLGEREAARIALVRARGEDAGTWLFCDARCPFSFSWCCSVLDLDQTAVRQAILSRSNEGMRMKKIQCWGGG